MPPKSEWVRQSLEAAANGREVLKKTRTDFETKNIETVPTTTGSVSKMHVDIPSKSMGIQPVQMKSQKSC